jgi:hypothetical protein
MNGLLLIAGLSIAIAVGVALAPIVLPIFGIVVAIAIGLLVIGACLHLGRALLVGLFVTSPLAVARGVRNALTVHRGRTIRVGLSLIGATGIAYGIAVAQTERDFAILGIGMAIVIAVLTIADPSHRQATGTRVAPPVSESPEATSATPASAQAPSRPVASAPR